HAAKAHGDRDGRRERRHGLGAPDTRARPTNVDAVRGQRAVAPAYALAPREVPRQIAMPVRGETHRRRAIAAARRDEGGERVVNGDVAGAREDAVNGSDAGAARNEMADRLGAERDARRA